MQNRTKVAAIILPLASIVAWTVEVAHPIFFFGIVAVMWLLALMLKGVFSPNFKPFTDEESLAAWAAQVERRALAGSSAQPGSEAVS